MQRVTRMEAPLFQLDSYSNPSSGRKLGEEFGMHFGMHIWLIWPPHWPAGSSEVDLTVLVPFHHRIATTISQQSSKFTSPASHICHIWHVLSFCLAIPMLTSLALMIQISAGHWEWNKGLAALEVGGLLPQHSAWHDLIQNDLTTEWMDAILPCPQVSHGAQSLSGAFKCWLKKHRASFFCMPGIPEPHPSAFFIFFSFFSFFFFFFFFFLSSPQEGPSVKVSKCQMPRSWGKGYLNRYVLTAQMSFQSRRAPRCVFLVLQGIAIICVAWLSVSFFVISLSFCMCPGNSKICMINTLTFITANFEGISKFARDSAWEWVKYATT